MIIPDNRVAGTRVIGLCNVLPVSITFPFSVKDCLKNFVLNVYTEVILKQEHKAGDLSAPISSTNVFHLGCETSRPIKEEMFSVATIFSQCNFDCNIFRSN